MVIPSRTSKTKSFYDDLSFTGKGIELGIICSLGEKM